MRRVGLFKNTYLADYKNLSLKMNRTSTKESSEARRTYFIFAHFRIALLILMMTPFTDGPPTMVSGVQ